MGRSVRRPSCFKQPSRWRLPVAPLIEQRRGDVSPTGSKPVREGRRELPAKLKTRGLQQRYFQESGSGRPGSFRGPTYRPCAVRCPGICFFIGQNCREFFKACLVLRAEDQRQVLALSTPSPEVRFLAFPPVHRADLEGPLRVELGPSAQPAREQKLRDLNHEIFESGSRSARLRRRRKGTRPERRPSAAGPRPRTSARIPLRSVLVRQWRKRGCRDSLG